MILMKPLLFALNWYRGEEVELNTINIFIKLKSNKLSKFDEFLYKEFLRTLKFSKLCSVSENLHFDSIIAKFDLGKSIVLKRIGNRYEFIYFDTINHTNLTVDFNSTRPSSNDLIDFYKQIRINKVYK